jgi:hypothetical protein
MIKLKITQNFLTSQGSAGVLIRNENLQSSPSRLTGTKISVMMQELVFDNFSSFVFLEI